MMHVKASQLESTSLFSYLHVVSGCFPPVPDNTIITFLSRRRNNYQKKKKIKCFIVRCYYFVSITIDSIYRLWRSNRIEEITDILAKHNFSFEMASLELID